jgi:hypothetical protein
MSKRRASPAAEMAEFITYGPLVEVEQAMDIATSILKRRRQLEGRMAGPVGVTGKRGRPPKQAGASPPVAMPAPGPVAS